MKLSIIVPVFNTSEELFDECLASIFSSSFENLEVIVVDDGSDISYEKIQKKYRNAKFFKTENEGTLKARLFGISKATGDYIVFVDSDDKVSFDYFEGLIEKAGQTNSDIVLGDWAFLTERGAYKCDNDYTIKNLFLTDGTSVLRMYFHSQGKEHSWYVLWNKIFKRELLESVQREIELLGAPKLVFAEDVLITFFAFTKAQKVTNEHLGTYFYRVHSGQQIAIDTPEKLLSHIKQMAKVFDAMERELKVIGRFEEVKFNFFAWKKLMSSSQYMVAKSSKFTELFDEIKRAYATQKLTVIPRDAERVYASHKLLPSNYDEIESALKKVLFSNKYLKVYAKKKSYAFSELVFAKKLLGKKFDLVFSKQEATFVMPKEKISLKLKLIHNEFIYKIGMLFFPKGSKIRNKLKSKL